MSRGRDARRRFPGGRSGRAAALAGAALAVLLAAEAACRIKLPPPPALDPGQRYRAIESVRPFFEKETVDGAVWLRQRPRLINSAAKKFRPAKDPGALRIFIVGESVAAHFANTRSIEALVTRLYPGRAVEVINCGTSGYRIHHWLPVALEVLGYDPDFLVVMSGNNEIGRPRVWEERAIRWRERLKRSRLLWALVLAADRWARARPVRPPPRDDERDARFYEARLDRLTSAARKAGCRVVLCRLPVNSKSAAPVSSIPRDFASFQAAFRSMGEGRYAEAAGMFESILRSEPDHPLSHYYAGLCSGELGDEARARAHLDRALLLDETRRQRGYVLRALERQARAPNVTVADLSAAFERAVGTPMLGREVFMDEWHWWPEFYGLTARVIVEAMGLDRTVDWERERRQGWQAEGRTYAAAAGPEAGYLVKKVFESLPPVRTDFPWFEENAVQSFLTLLERSDEPALSLDEERVLRIVRDNPQTAGITDPDLSSFYVHLAEGHRRRGDAKTARALLAGLAAKEAPAPALLTQALLDGRNGEHAAAERRYQEHRAAVEAWRRRGGGL